MSVLTMKYALGTVLAVIHDQSVATLQALLLRDGPCRKHQVAQQTLVVVFSCTDALSSPTQRNSYAESYTKSGCAFTTGL